MFAGAVIEPAAFVGGLDDLAMMGEAVEQCGAHLGVTEDGWPFAEGEIGRDDDRGALIEPADQMEQQLAACVGKRQVSEFVEYSEVQACEVVGDAALLA